MPRIKYDREEVLADWKTGKYTERDLASKHKISPATAHNVVKGIEKTLSTLISKQVEINQQLSEHNEQEVSKFKQEVDERTKHIQFFNQAALKNVSVAVKKITVETSQAEHRMLADTILKGKETVIGKQPETAIQINNNNDGSFKLFDKVQLKNMTDQELMQLQSLLGKVDENVSAG